MNETRKWDEWNQAGGPNYPHGKVIQFCLRKYPREMRSSVRVLDLGCGTGANTWFLAREGFSVTATDISPQAIAATQSRLDRSDLSARLRIESADAISDPPESFDLVICIGVLEATGPEIARRTLTGIHRVLAPKGSAFLLFAADGDFRVGSATPYSLHGYSEAEVRDLSSIFDSALLDRYVTTYEGGRIMQLDWILTCGK